MDKTPYGSTRKAIGSSSYRRTVPNTRSPATRKARPGAASSSSKKSIKPKSLFAEDNGSERVKGESAWISAEKALLIATLTKSMISKSIVLRHPTLSQYVCVSNQTMPVKKGWNTKITP